MLARVERLAVWFAGILAGAGPLYFFGSNHFNLSFSEAMQALHSKHYKDLAILAVALISIAAVETLSATWKARSRSWIGFCVLIIGISTLALYFLFVANLSAHFTKTDDPPKLALHFFYVVPALISISKGFLESLEGSD